MSVYPRVGGDPKEVFLATFLPRSFPLNEAHILWIASRFFLVTRSIYVKWKCVTGWDRDERCAGHCVARFGCIVSVILESCVFLGAAEDCFFLKP